MSYLNAQIPNIVISEIMYNSPEAGSDTLEFIELYNNDTVDHDVTGFYLTGVTFTFPNFIFPKKSYVILSVDTIAFEIFFGFSPDFIFTGGLNNSGEYITLKDSLNILIDSVNYDDVTPWPLEADGLGKSLVLCNVNSDNTLPENWSVNFVNFIDSVNNYPVYATPGAPSNCYGESIVVTEIMYNSPESGTDTLEFIELLNTSDYVLNLDGLSISEGVQFNFPFYLMQPNEYLVVCKSSDAFSNFYGVLPSFVWNSGGALSNSGELIQLKDVDGVLVDSVFYSNSTPWPSLANGQGFSLSLCDVTFDNSLASSWSIDSTNYIGTIDSINVYATPFADCGQLSVSVSENKFANIRVFPNPTKDLITIQHPFENIKNTLYNIHGQAIFVSFENILNLENVPSGVYLIVSEHETAIIKHTIIKK